MRMERGDIRALANKIAQHLRGELHITNPTNPLSPTAPVTEHELTNTIAEAVEEYFD